MMTVVIVGSGVLGLSLAAHLSKFHFNVIVLSANFPTAGSLSAAANLATKGQQFARDPHFELKLLARAKYRSWLEELLKVKYGDSTFQIQTELDAFFQKGVGVDLFYDSAQAEKQLKRTREDFRPNAGTHTHYDPHSVRKVGDTQVVYENEMWVHGGWLLDLLKHVCIKRNVSFVNQKVICAEQILRYFESTDFTKPSTKVFFCAGAWSLEICERLNLNLAKVYRGSPRLTMGASLNLRDFGFLEVNDQVEKRNTILLNRDESNKGKKSNNINLTLLELNSESGEKLTLSGNSQNTFVSSLSEKFLLSQLNDSNLEHFKEPQFYQKILEVTGKWISWRTLNNPFKQVILSQGFRLGFGHSEILCQHLEGDGPLNSLKPVILAGAHKSGFLFAAVVEEMLHRHQIVI